ncbi:hypothetical protein L6164_022942 [Bauhinia variegata]|uniref:Uncharacterized protein n=1 Tax=Bauhinia variegata TaxID=167791 RepID=A0ACB9MI83_BAUVA|nr:hypothetical protein L6164_022942 [Bauhinia variegata]
MEFLLLCAVTLSPATESETTRSLSLLHSWKASAKPAEVGAETPLEPSSLGPSSPPLLARSLSTKRNPETCTELAERNRGVEVEQVQSLKKKKNSKPFSLIWTLELLWG